LDTPSYALVNRAHPRNSSNSDAVKLTVSLNEQSSQGRSFLPRVCLAFFSWGIVVNVWSTHWNSSRCSLTSLRQPLSKTPTKRKCEV